MSTTTFDDRRLLVRRSKKLEKILGEAPPSELIRPISNYDSDPILLGPVDKDTKRMTLPRSKSQGRSSLRKLWNDKSSREQPLPHSAQSPTFLDLSLSSSSESLVSASSDEGLKIALPLNAMQPPKRATHPRSPSFTPHTPALRPRMNRADSVISYFSLSIGSSTPSTPVDRTPTATPDRERKRKVQNVSKVSRTLGECPKTVVEGIAGKKAPDGQVVIRKESRSLELASRGGDKLASVPQRDVLSDTEAARPPAFAKMNVGRKWIRERGSRYYVEEDYEVIRSTLRMLR